MPPMRALLFAICLAAAAAFGQQGGEDTRRGIAAVEEALKQRPNDAALYFYLARFQAEAGNARASVAALEKVAELGSGFLPARELGFEKVWDDPAFQAIVKRLAESLPRLDYAPIAIELEDAELIPEGIAYDAHSQSFFIGSIAKKKIVRIEWGNAVSDFTRAD